MKMATSESDSLLAVDKKFKDLLAKITDANVASLPKNLFANEDVSRKKNWLRPSMIDRAIRPLVSTSTPTPFNNRKLNFTPEKSIPVSPISCDASFKRKPSELAEPLERNSERGSKEEHKVNSQVPSAITLSSLTASMQASKQHLKEDESIQTDFVAPQLQVSQVTSAADPKMNEGESISINYRVTKLEKIIQRLSYAQKKTPSIAKRLSTSDKPMQTSRKSLSQSLNSKKLARSMFTQTAKERQTQTGFSLIGQNRRSSDASSVSSGGSETSNFIADLETSKILNRSHLKVVVPPSYSDEEPTIHVDKPWRLPSRLNNNVEMPLFSSRQLSETDESSLDDTFLPKLPKKKKVFTNRKRILVGSAKKKKILSTDKENVKDTQPKIVVLSDVKIANVEKAKEPNDETVENTVEKIEDKQQSPLQKKSTRTSTQKKTKKSKEDEATLKQPVDNKKTPISKKSLETIKTTPRRTTRSSLRSEFKQDISEQKILAVEEKHVEKSTDRRATWDSHCSEKSAKTKKSMEKKNKNESKISKKQNKKPTKKENVSHQTEEKENTNFQVFEENLIENGESIEHVDKRTSTRIDHDIQNKEIEEETISEKKTKIITRECGTSPIDFEETAKEQTTEVRTNETNVKKTGTKKSKLNTEKQITSMENSKNEQTHRKATTKQTTVQIHREERSPVKQIDFGSFSRMDRNSNEESFKQIKKNVTNKRMTEKIPVEQNVTDAEETNKKGRNLNRKETIEDGVVDFEENATSETEVKQQVKKKRVNKQTASKKKKEIEQPRKSTKGKKRKIETDVEEFQQEVFHDNSMKTVRVTLESLPKDVVEAAKKKSNITTLKMSSPEFSGMSSASSTNPDGLRRSTRERKAPPPRAGFMVCKSEKDLKTLNRVLGVSQTKRNSKMTNSRNTNITSSSSSSVNPIEYDTMNRRTFEPIEESFSEYNAESEDVSKSKKKKPTRNIKSGRVSKVKTKNATNDPLKILKKQTRLSTTVEPVEIPIENFLSVYDGAKLHTFPWACSELNYHSLDDTLGISMTHCVANPTLGTTSGLLKIEPGKNKPKQLTKQHSMNFFIVDGEAEVGVQDKRKVLSKFNTFVVPRGSEYYIKNLSKKKALILYFTKAIPRDC